MLSEAVGVTGHNIMFSSNDTPAEDFRLADKLGAIINLMISAILSSLKVRSDIFLRRSAAVTIQAAYLRSVMISWTIREMPNMV